MDAGGSLVTEAAMLFKKNYKTAAATFVVAITTGFVMQNGDALASRFATAESQASAIEPIEIAQNLAAEEPSPPVLPDPPSTPNFLNRTKQDFTPSRLSSDQAYSALGLKCDVSFEATKALGAMVMLDYKAPCHVNEAVTVSHQGMSFTAITSDIGQFSIEVPAMVAEATFNVILIDGSRVSKTVNVPEVSGYDRVALQWTGDSGLRIHALEMGAAHGERGHVWAKSPQSVATALQARGGYITELGDIDYPAAKHIEIYSFPTGHMQKTGLVRLSVEVEVTANTCNKEIRAQALQSGVDSEVSIVDLMLSMPACDAVGDFLVLNNLLRDLKIAQN